MEHTMEKLLNNHSNSKKSDYSNGLEIELVDRLLSEVERLKNNHAHWMREEMDVQNQLRTELMQLKSAGKSNDDSGEIIPHRKAEKSHACTNCRKRFSCTEYEELAKGLDMKVFAELSASHCCAEYKSMYIEFPIQVADIQVINEHMDLHKNQIGRFASVRPADDKKTYLGLFLGELPLYPSVRFMESSGVLSVGSVCNPAMFVFDLNKIVYGAESWWGIIEKEDDLKHITDADINNVWYMRALRSLETKSMEDSAE